MAHDREAGRAGRKGGGEGGSDFCCMQTMHLGHLTTCVSCLLFGRASSCGARQRSCMTLCWVRRQVLLNSDDGFRAISRIFPASS